MGNGQYGRVRGSSIWHDVGPLVRDTPHLGDIQGWPCGGWWEYRYGQLSAPLYTPHPSEGRIYFDENLLLFVSNLEWLSLLSEIWSMRYWMWWRFNSLLYIRTKIGFLPWLGHGHWQDWHFYLLFLPRTREDQVEGSEVSSSYQARMPWYINKPYTLTPPLLVTWCSDAESNFSIELFVGQTNLTWIPPGLTRLLLYSNRWNKLLDAGNHLRISFILRYDFIFIVKQNSICSDKGEFFLLKESKTD